MPTPAEKKEADKVPGMIYLIYAAERVMDKVALATDIPNFAMGLYAGYMHAAGQPVDAPWLIGTVGATSAAHGIEKMVKVKMIKSKESLVSRFDEAFWVSVPVGTIELGVGYAAGAIVQKFLSAF